MLLGSCFICSVATSQSNYRSGLLPSINLNKEIAKDWQLNFKIESRQLLKERSLGNITPYDYLHTVLPLSFQIKWALIVRLVVDICQD